MGDLKLETIAAQAGNKKCTTTGAVNMPIYFSTAYRHEDLGVSTGYDYTRTGNPTRAALEEVFASLEDGRYAFATSSGMSAIQLVCQLFQAGDHLITTEDLYGGTYRYFEQISNQYNITFDCWNGENITDLAAFINPKTKAVFIETPSNPLMKEVDLAPIVSLARKHHLLVIVDNTFYTPVIAKPLQLGADIVIHSATKYLGGHNDVLAGAVITSSDQLGTFFTETLNATGAVLSPFDSWLLLRGIKTLPLRIKQHEENAQAIATYLASHPYVTEVRYPRRGGMVSFFIKDKTKISPFLRALTLITFAESLGGVESLITYPATQTHADIPKEKREKYGLTDELLRISVGIEAKEDLIADLAQAFAKIS